MENLTYVYFILKNYYKNILTQGIHKIFLINPYTQFLHVTIFNDYISDCYFE